MDVALNFSAPLFQFNCQRSSVNCLVHYSFSIANDLHHQIMISLFTFLCNASGRRSDLYWDCSVLLDAALRRPWTGQHRGVWRRVVAVAVISIQPQTVYKGKIVINKILKSDWSCFLSPLPRSSRLMAPARWSRQFQTHPQMVHKGNNKINNWSTKRTTCRTRECMDMLASDVDARGPAGMSKDSQITSPSLKRGGDK